MKKTLTIIAAVAMLSQIASAQLIKNVKYEGKIDINAYTVENADFDDSTDDKQGDVDTRVTLDVTFDLSDKIDAGLSVIKTRDRWTGTTQEPTNTIEKNLLLEQAYLNIKDLFNMSHKIGRQYYGNKGDMVIYYGPQDWPYIPYYPYYAIDGLVSSYTKDDLNLKFLLAKEANLGYDKKWNIGVYGIDLSKNVSRWNLNAYVYNKRDQENGNGGDNLFLAGIKANWKCTFEENLNLTVEGNKNFGKDKVTDTKHKGFAYKINADYSMDLAGKLGLMAEYTFMSGQDSSSDDKLYRPINSDYRPGIIANGYGVDTTYVGAIGTGYKGLHFGANWTPSSLEKLNLALTYYNMKVAEKNPLMKDTIGNELDLVATWKHSDNIHVKGYYAMFKPEKDNTLTDDAQTMLGAAFVVKF